MYHTSIYLKRGWRSLPAVFIFVALLLTVTPAAWAYTALIYSPAHPSTSYTMSFSTFDELFDAIKADPPANHIPGFDPVNDPLKVDINYAGALVTVDVPAASTDVTVAAPALGISQTFTGTGRDEALTNAETEFTNDSSGFVESLDTYIEEASSGTGGGGGGGCFITTVF